MIENKTQTILASIKINVRYKSYAHIFFSLRLRIMLKSIRKIDKWLSLFVWYNEFHELLLFLNLSWFLSSFFFNSFSFN